MPFPMLSPPLSPTASDSQRPPDTFFPQSDRSLRLPSSNSTLNPSNSGDTRLLTKKQHMYKKRTLPPQKKEQHTNNIPRTTLENYYMELKTTSLMGSSWNDLEDTASRYKSATAP